MSSSIVRSVETDEIHDRLKEARRARELTQMQLKERLAEGGFATTQTSIGEYETGRTKPSAAYVQAFCKVLEIDPRWVLWRERYSMELESPTEAEALLLVVRQLLLPQSGSSDMIRRLVLQNSR